MDIKVLNNENKTVSLTVISSGEFVNIDAILNMDTSLNEDIDQIDLINSAIVENKAILSTTKKTTLKMSKNNKLIPNSYKAMKKTVFEKLNECKDIEKVNEWINLCLMARFINELNDKIYNEYDFWYTHNDSKIPKLEQGTRKLAMFKTLLENKNSGKK